MLLLACGAALAAGEAEHPSLAVVEIGIASTNGMSYGTGGALRTEVGFRGFHLGVDASYIESEKLQVGYGPLGVDMQSVQFAYFRPLLTGGYYVADRRVQVGAGMAAGPFWSFERSDDRPTETHASAALYWTATFRLRIAGHFETFLGQMGRFDEPSFDGWFGVGWIR